MVVMELLEQQVIKLLFGTRVQKQQTVQMVRVDKEELEVAEELEKETVFRVVGGLELVEAEAEAEARVVLPVQVDMEVEVLILFIYIIME
jgi:hypothetical protein